MSKYEHLIEECTTIRARARVMHSIGWDRSSSHYSWLCDSVKQVRDNGGSWKLISESALCSVYRAKKLYSEA